MNSKAQTANLLRMNEKHDVFVRNAGGEAYCVEQQRQTRRKEGKKKQTKHHSQTRCLNKTENRDESAVNIGTTQNHVAQKHKHKQVCLQQQNKGTHTPYTPHNQLSEPRVSVNTPSTGAPAIDRIAKVAPVPNFAKHAFFTKFCECTV